VFWVNVPVGALAAVAAARLLPGERGSGAGRPGLPGALVAGAGLTLVVYPLIAGAGLTMLPWSVTVTVLAGLSAAVLLPRIGRTAVLLGLALTAVGLALLAIVAASADSRTGTLTLLPGILLGSAGMGLVVPPAWPTADRICPGHCGPAAPLTPRRALSTAHGPRQRSGRCGR
jgi:hypothetical protein